MGNRYREPHQKDLGLESVLLRLPDMIARAADEGRPIIVEHEAGALEPHTQRLYATLGVLVRFKPRTGPDG